jgi:hypothetical protein
MIEKAAPPLAGASFDTVASRPAQDDDPLGLQDSSSSAAALTERVSTDARLAPLR